MPYRTSVLNIPDGDAGIEATLRHMERLIDKASGDPRFIRIAQRIATTTAPRDEDAQAQAILAWVREHTFYVHDPIGKELVKDADFMMRELQESGTIPSDCDDQVVLTASLLRAVGIDAEPIVVSPDQGTYTHVLLRYHSPKIGWVTMDPITRNGLGWFPSGAARVGVFRNGRIDPSSPQTVQGLGGYDARNPGVNYEATTQTIGRWADLIWFAIGAAALWKWARTGRAPL